MVTLEDHETLHGSLTAASRVASTAGWWAFVLKTRKLRLAQNCSLELYSMAVSRVRKHDIKRDLKRLRREPISPMVLRRCDACSQEGATFKAWFEAVAEQLQEADIHRESALAHIVSKASHQAVAVAEAELRAFRALSDAPEASEEAWLPLSLSPCFSVKESSIPFAEPVTMAAMFEPVHCFLAPSKLS